MFHIVGLCLLCSAVSHYRSIAAQPLREVVDSHLAFFRSAPLQVPPGLTLCQKELAAVAGAFVRLVAYNRSVFGDFYCDIIENHVLFREAGEKREV